MLETLVALICKPNTGILHVGICKINCIWMILSRESETVEIVTPDISFGHGSSSIGLHIELP